MHVQTGLEFQDGIRVQNLKIPLKKNHNGGRLPPCKILSFPEIFAFMKRHYLFTKNLPIFMQCWTISYCLLIGGDSFLNAVQSENSKHSCGISCILPAFGEIIIYSCNMIVDLKIINCEKVCVLAISSEISKFCQYLAK